MAPRKPEKLPYWPHGRALRDLLVLLEEQDAAATKAD